MPLHKQLMLPAHVDKHLMTVLYALPTVCDRSEQYSTHLRAKPQNNEVKHSGCCISRRVVRLRCSSTPRNALLHYESGLLRKAKGWQSNLAFAILAQRTDVLD